MTETPEEVKGNKPAPHGVSVQRLVMHLRYDLMTAGIDCGINDHPQKMMQKLGVAYQHATPQSMGDQWWFWNCENIPDNLPEYLTRLDLDPMECIGWGLSKSDAEKIRDYSA